VKPRIWYSASCDCGWVYPGPGMRAVKVDVDEHVKYHRTDCAALTKEATS
jgi:hypothetical protein